MGITELRTYSHMPQIRQGFCCIHRVRSAVSGAAECACPVHEGRSDKSQSFLSRDKPFFWFNKSVYPVRSLVTQRARIRFQFEWWWRQAKYLVNSSVILALAYQPLPWQHSEPTPSQSQESPIFTACGKFKQGDSRGLRHCTDLEESQMGNCYLNLMTLARLNFLKSTFFFFLIRKYLECQPKEILWHLQNDFDLLMPFLGLLPCPLALLSSETLPVFPPVSDLAAQGLLS